MSQTLKKLAAHRADEICPNLLVFYPVSWFAFHYQFISPAAYYMWKTKITGRETLRQNSNFGVNQLVEQIQVQPLIDDSDAHCILYLSDADASRAGYHAFHICFQPVVMNDAVVSLWRSICVGGQVQFLYLWSTACVPFCLPSLLGFAFRFLCVLCARECERFCIMRPLFNTVFVHFVAGLTAELRMAKDTSASG